MAFGGQPDRGLAWFLSIILALGIWLAWGLNGNRVTAAIYSGQVGLSPSVLASQLNILGIRGLIGEAVTHFDPAVNGRAANVRLAAANFSNLLVAPGQTISYLDLIGPTTVERGYREAYTIIGDEFVPGLGGGVCQVSSTLYLAWVRAGLGVVERHQHSLPVSYLPPGLDATVAEGYLDLRLKNPGPGYVWVRSEVDGDRLTVRIYGDAPSGRMVRVYTQTLKTYPIPEKVKLEPDLPEGKTTVELPGAQGAISVTYREFWREKKLVRKEKLSSDYYAPAPKVILKGIRPPGS